MHRTHPRDGARKEPTTGNDFFITPERYDTIPHKSSEKGLPVKGQQVVGRFAPTPSGRMHLGNAFSYLMAWLATRASGGRMVLRIEDLDPRAQNREAAQLILDDLAWLGLDWDEGPYFQSRRADAYAEAISRLDAMGLTYPCFCTRSELHAATAPHASDGTYVYQGACRDLTRAEAARRALARPPATRVRVPDESDPASTVKFTDLVYGPQEENLARECGDFLVRRSDGIVAYQLAVVVDDGLMGVNQVVRGNDLLGSVARQTYLHRLLGYAVPSFAHVPLFVTPDGRRLSKRDRDLDLGVIREREQGPERIIGILAHAVGLAEKNERISADKLVSRFAWETLANQRENIVVDGEFLTQ